MKQRLEKIRWPLLLMSLVVVAGCSVAMWIWMIQRHAKQPVSIAEAYAPLQACGPQFDAANKLGSADVTKLIDEQTPAAIKKELQSTLNAMPPTILDALLRLGFKLLIHQEAAKSAQEDDPSSSVLRLDEKTHTPKLDLRFLRDQDDPEGGRRAIHELVIPILTRYYTDSLLPDILPVKAINSPGTDPQLSLLVLRAKVAEALSQGTPDSSLELKGKLGPTWPSLPAAQRRATNFAVHWFYCSPSTRTKFRQLYPQAEAFFARSFGCLFGPPWYEPATNMPACG